MKIGLVSPYYMHRPGGVQTLLDVLEHRLRRKGHQVTIIAPKPRLKKDIVRTPKNVKLLGQSAEIKFRAPFHTTHPVAAVFEPGAIEDFLAKQKFDVLNVHEPWMPMLPYQIVQNANCPVVGTLHARWPRSMVNITIEKARTPYVRSAIKKLDLITAVSPVAAQNAIEADANADVRIIPNAINTQNFHKGTVKNKFSTPTILYLNRLERRKGPMYLLKAYKDLHQKYPSLQVRLIMAGDGPQAKKLQDYAIKHDLDGVEFEGYVSEERKMQLLKQATIYCSPAPYGESFGIVLLEAMASSLPIVAGNNEGYQSVLTGTGAISLIDPKDTLSFSERLLVMIENQDIRRAWKRWAVSEIKKYDFNRIVDLYEQAYQESIN